MPQRPFTPTDEPCGLTPASLKHLRRQRDGLSEDKDRLVIEVARLNALLREQRERVVELEATAPAADAIPEPTDVETTIVEAEPDSSARDEREAAWALMEAKLRAQIDSLEEERSLLDLTLERREKEMGELRCSLKEQEQCTKDEREAKERAMEAEARSKKSSSDLSLKVLKLEAEILKLNSQKGDVEDEKGEMSQQIMKAHKETSMKDAELETLKKAFDEYKDQTEKLRTGLVGTAIQSKLELHISVPHVVLTYNNAPPLTVSTAIGLSKARILKFLESMLFPHFEPLWVCLDGVDCAPDGTNKRRYSGRMLERLTNSIKDFIEKSQLGEQAELVGQAVSEKSGGEARPRSRSSTTSSGFRGLGSLRSSER